MDEMATLLGREQKDDDSKNAYCESKLGENEDEAKRLDQALSDLGKAMEATKENIATLGLETKEIEATARSSSRAGDLGFGIR